MNRSENNGLERARIRRRVADSSSTDAESAPPEVIVISDDEEDQPVAAAPSFDLNVEYPGEPEYAEDQPVAAAPRFDLNVANPGEPEYEEDQPVAAAPAPNFDLNVEYPGEPDYRDLNEPAWYYIDPEGLMQGPFSDNALKLWWDAGFFPPNLTVYLGKVFGIKISLLFSAYNPTN